MTCPQDLLRELVKKRQGRVHPSLATSGIRNQSGPIMRTSYRNRALTEPKDASSTGTALPLKVKIGASSEPLEGNIS
jgi:hypothetical protein